MGKENDGRGNVDISIVVFSNGGKNIIAYGLDYDLTNADYNWKDIIFSTGMTQNYDLSFSRGTDKI